MHYHITSHSTVILFGTQNKYSWPLILSYFRALILVNNREYYGIIHKYSWSPGRVVYVSSSGNFFLPS